MLVFTMQLHSKQKQTNLKLTTWPKQLLASLPLAFDEMASRQNNLTSYQKPLRLLKWSYFYNFNIFFQCDQFEKKSEYKNLQAWIYI
jgi:hypothetical protein